jgi:hypothetical protein
MSASHPRSRYLHIWTQSSYHSMNSLIPFSGVLLQKLIFARLLNQFPVFYAPKGSFPGPQEPTTGLYPECDKSSPISPSIPSQIHFNMSQVFPVAYLQVFLTNILHQISISFMHATCPPILIIVFIIQIMKLPTAHILSVPCYLPPTCITEMLPKPITACQKT